MKYHESVMTAEVLSQLRVEEGKKYIDCTLGDGGHSLKILQLGGVVLGLDVSDDSLANTRKRLSDEGFSKNFIGVKGNFKDIENLAKQNNFNQVDGILYDLGYSSTQLESDDSGLSFLKDQPLDMRLDKTLGVTAADLLNILPEAELARMFFEYSDERMSRRFASAIVKARNLKKFESTKDLADLLKSIASPGYEHNRIHPATRVFQALRIAVNGELDNLEKSLPQAARLLLPGGRMAVISFHSLEDKLVKEFGLHAQPSINVVTKKPLEPTEQEVLGNSRARSAKMRVFERN